MADRDSEMEGGRGWRGDSHHQQCADITSSDSWKRYHHITQCYSIQCSIPNTASVNARSFAVECVGPYVIMSLQGHIRNDVTTSLAPLPTQLLVVGLKMATLCRLHIRTLVWLDFLSLGGWKSPISSSCCPLSLSWMVIANAQQDRVHNHHPWGNYITYSMRWKWCPAGWHSRIQPNVMVGTSCKSPSHNGVTSGHARRALIALGMPVLTPRNQKVLVPPSPTVCQTTLQYHPVGAIQQFTRLD